MQPNKSLLVAMLSFRDHTHGFEVGMKVEAVDRRNPILIRVSTVKDVDSQQNAVTF